METGNKKKSDYINSLDSSGNKLSLFPHETSVFASIYNTILTYFLQETHTGRILYINDIKGKTITETIDDFCETFQQNFFPLSDANRIVITVSPQKITLVPEAFYDSTSTEKLFYCQYSGEKKGNIISDKINSLSGYLLFQEPEEITTYLSKKIPNVKIIHAASAWLDAIMPIHKNETDERVYLNIESEYIYIAVTKQGELIFFNIFEKQTNEDVAYYLLYSMEKLGINPDVSPLYISGKIDNTDDCFNLLYNYVRSVFFLSSGLLLPTETEQKPHKFFLLLSMAGY